ncbi:unnamed protein product, partial [Effrenium voratum]
SLRTSSWSQICAAGASFLLSQLLTERLSPKCRSVASRRLYHGRRRRPCSSFAGIWR